MSDGAVEREAPHARTRPRNTIDVLSADMPAITSLRFFAALWVLFFHFGSTAVAATAAPVAIKNFMANGYLGVSFFFVLSGFVLTAAYRGKLGSSSSAKTFLVARFARIYPIYLLALIAILPMAQPIPLASAITSPLLLQSWMPVASMETYGWNGPGWTLSAELFFYLAFIPASVAIRRLAPIALALTVIALVAIITAFALATTAPGEPFPPMSLIVPKAVLRFPEFLLGCTVAEGLFRLDRYRLTPLTDIWLGGAAVLGLAAAAYGSWAVNVTPAIFACIIALAAISVGPVGRILGHRWLVLLGASSYSLYLFQAVVNAYFDAWFGTNIIGRLAMPLTLIALSIVLYLWVEEPCRRWIKSRYGHRSGESCPAR